MTDGIIVLGMHRSGTSLTAELVCRWGAYGSERDLVPPSQWNARGYWEYAPLVRFNDRLLQGVDSKWNVPPSEDGASALARLARKGAYRKEALQLLDKMRSAGRTWFWKDPRLSILLPFWRRLWKDVTYVIVVRDPLDIALSLRARDHLPISASLLLWQRYMVEILRWTRTHRSKIFVDYDSLLDRGPAECARLSKFLDAECRPGEKLDMKAALDPTLRRHRNATTRANQIYIADGQRELMSILRGLTKRRRQLAESEIVAHSPHSAWREYLAVLDTLRQLSLLTGIEKQQELFATLPRSYRGIFGG